MKSNQVIQISGTPGQIVGIVPVQSNGTIAVKLVGEMLQISSESFFGLETKEVFIPIEDVRAIETGEGCTWWLFWLGIPTLSIFIGVVFIILAFIVKQRYLTIYSSRVNVIVFHRKGEKVAQFRTGVLEARYSKSLALAKPPMPPPPSRPLNI